jgi:uncharacterized protein (DUF302 family)
MSKTASVIVTAIVFLVIGAAGASLTIKAMMPKLLISEVVSPLPFEETLEHVEAKAKELGWKVPQKWKANFQKNFQKIVGVDIGPNKLIKMCQPKVAADILVKDEYKYLGVMMPCTFAVYEKADGKTYVSMMNLGMMGLAFGDEVAAAMRIVGPEMDAMVAFDDK